MGELTRIEQRKVNAENFPNPHVNLMRAAAAVLQTKQGAAAAAAGGKIEF